MQISVPDAILQMDHEETAFTEAVDTDDFATRTGCDSLAISIGTSHGAYKFVLPTLWYLFW